MRKFLILFCLLTLLLSGCSFDNPIDQKKDYTSNLADGEYTATSEHYSSLGYKQSLSFLIKKGIITKVNYQEIDHNGISRLDNLGFNQSWAGCDLTYGQLLDHLYTDSILSQGKEVDSVTGATKTVTDYEMLQDALLEEILNRKTQNIKVDTFNDVYQVTNDVDPVTGSQEQLTVEFVGGQLRSASIRQVTNNAAYYAIGRVYATLAEQTQQTHTLEPVNNPTVDSHVLGRYNQLLEQVKELRG